MANYSGEHLAKKGVVYVAMNYRVGAFGFMAHPELSAEHGRKASGNWGLLDQVAALQWIHRNIARFGGDPDNVTIMGQSAGSASVFVSAVEPRASGLIHRVFGMSASAIVSVGAGRTATLAEAEQSGLQLQAALKAGSLADMRLLPADVIYAAQRGAGAPRFQPVVDLHLLPAMPNEIFAAGRQIDVPVLLGFMRDESSTRCAGRSRSRSTGRGTDAVWRAAAAVPCAVPRRQRCGRHGLGARAAREAGMESTMRAWARAQAKTGKAPVYINVFSRVHPYAEGVTFSDHDPKTVGAYHTGEVPYWFQTQDAYNLFRATRTGRRTIADLANKLSDALITFAKTGSPNTPAIVWPRYDPRERTDDGVRRRDSRAQDEHGRPGVFRRPPGGGPPAVGTAGPCRPPAARQRERSDGPGLVWHPTCLSCPSRPARSAPLCSAASAASRTWPSTGSRTSCWSAASTTPSSWRRTASSAS